MKNLHRQARATGLLVLVPTLLASALTAGASATPLAAPVADKLVTNDGRVLNVVGIDPDRDKARHKAYAAAALVAFDGKQLRTDIAR